MAEQMNLEEAFTILEGCLIEPIINDGHSNPCKRRVIEASYDEYNRVIGYGNTFEEALVSAAKQYKEL